jgi:hypothetical protein
MVSHNQQAGAAIRCRHLQSVCMISSTHFIMFTELSQGVLVGAEGGGVHHAAGP